MASVEAEAVACGLVGVARADRVVAISVSIGVHPWLTPFAIALLAIVWASPVLGHGAIDLQIKDVTDEIAKQPNSAELYMRRGELHRAHQDWDSAYADYERVEALEPRMTVVDLGRGKMFLEANWPRSAVITLDRYLANNTNNAEGLATRARAKVKLGLRRAAAEDYCAAIEHSAESRPELFLERAQALTAEGSQHFGDALQGLDAGMAKMGPLVTLQLYAIDLEMKQSHFDAALARLDKVSAQSPRKETWLARRGEILQQAGRPDEARKAFVDALTALDKLPQARRNVPAMQELEKRIRSAIASTKPQQP